MQSSFNSSCLFVLVLSSLCSPILFAQTKQPPAQRWEYRTTSNDLELEKLGDEGWELVAAAYHPSGGSIYYTLKRPKPADAPRYVEPAKRPAPPPSAPTCELTHAQAPTFRGIRLGMEVKELLRLFPGSEENPEIKRRLEQANKPMGSFGLTDFRISASSYQNVKEVKDLFADIDSYVFTLFDGRLVAFYVSFSHNPNINWNKGIWQKKLSEALKLPLTDKWGNPDYSGDDALPCEGFSIWANGGTNPSFSIRERTQPSFYDAQSQRMRAALEKLREEFKINP